ncbi:MAG: DUF58 domain-containing protein, partial [Chloroflexota bacterium]
PKPIPVTLYEGAGGRGQVRSYLQREVDGSVGELRSYTVADAISRIHWRTSARVGNLMVAEPERTARGSTLLLVDLGGSAEAVNQVAGMASYLVSDLARQGKRVGLVAAGDSVRCVPAFEGPERTAELVIPLAVIGNAPESQIDELVRAAQRVTGIAEIVVLSANRALEPALRRLRRRVESVQSLHPPAST